jgi:hypothetical protein
MPRQSRTNLPYALVTPAFSALFGLKHWMPRLYLRVYCRRVSDAAMARPIIRDADPFDAFAGA